MARHVRIKPTSVGAGSAAKAAICAFTIKKGTDDLVSIKEWQPDSDSEVEVEVEVNVTMFSFALSDLGSEIRPSRTSIDLRIFASNPDELHVEEIKRSGN